MNLAQATAQTQTGDEFTRILLIFASVLAVLLTVSRTARELLASLRAGSRQSKEEDVAALQDKINTVTELLEEEKRANADYRRLCAELYSYILAAQRDPDRLQDHVPELPSHRAL